MKKQINVAMEVFVVILSSAVYIECVHSKDTMNDDLSHYLLDCLMKKLMERTTPQPISSTQTEKLSDTSKDTFFDDNSETPEEFFTKLFQESGPETLGSSQLSLNQGTSTPSYLSALPLTTSSTSSPLSVVPTINNNNVGSFTTASSKPQAGSYYHPPSNDFQYSQPSVPKQHEYPSAPQQQASTSPFHNIPQDVPHSNNPSSFYNPQYWKSPAISPQNENNPYNPPPHIPDELNPILYQSPLIPIGPAEQPSHFPQVYSGPQISYSPVPFSSLNDETQTNSGPSLYSQFVNHLLQKYGIPGQVVSSYVGTSNTQDGIPLVQFQDHHPSLHPVYAPQPHQLSEEDILSLIQNSHTSSLPNVSSLSSNPFYFTSLPAQSYSNHPNPASAPSYREQVSGTFSSSPVRNSAPFSLYREPRTPLTLGGPGPDSQNGDLKTPVYGNPNHLHFI